MTSRTHSRLLAGVVGLLLIGGAATASAGVGFRIGGRNLDTLVRSANAARTPEEVDAALRRLEDARGELEDRAPFHVAVGTLYLRKGDLEQAKRAFQAAVARDPNSADAHMGLGNVAIAKRETREALQHYQKAVELAPGRAPARYQLAAAHLRA